MFETTRRRALQALGVGGATAVAGCSVRAPTADAENQRKRVEQQSVPSVDRVAADPTDVPDPIDRSEPTDVDVTLRPEEVTAEIEPGVIFDFMTDNGQVPGPMIRVRNGDTVNLTFENPAENVLPHNVDFHAAAGPGGGAEATMSPARRRGPDARYTDDGARPRGYIPP